MNGYELAVKAVKSSQPASPFVSAEVRQKLAIAELALLVYGMDHSTLPLARIRKLEDGIKEIHLMLPSVPYGSGGGRWS